MSQFATEGRIDSALMDGAAAFDAAFARRAPQLGVRPETADDPPFVRALFCRCSPLAGVLPPQLLEVQALTQDAAFTSAYPSAMRRIVSAGAHPIGRIVVDWTPDDVVHGVDIAVDPDRRASGAGLAMLRAWLDAVDALGKASRLEVRADNPARTIYMRLGFVAVPGATEHDAFAVMLRPARREGRSQSARM